MIKHINFGNKTMTSIIMAVVILTSLHMGLEYTFELIEVNVESYMAALMGVFIMFLNIIFGTIGCVALYKSFFLKNKKWLFLTIPLFLMGTTIWTVMPVALAVVLEKNLVPAFPQ